MVLSKPDTTPVNGHSYLLILVSIDSDDHLSCAMTSAKRREVKPPASLFAIFRATAHSITLGTNSPAAATLE